MESVNLFKMPDTKLIRLARRYRALCRIQKTTPVLMRGGRLITFEQFLADSVTVEIIMQEYKGKNCEVRRVKVEEMHLLIPA